MNSQQAFEWQFGGWPGLAPWLGWTVLALVAAGGVTLAAWLYRDTLQALSPRQRLIFILLRAGFFLALLLCLAGPSRVMRTYESGNESRPLAVVIDRSGSMNAPDTTGLSRATASLRMWKESEAAAIHSFPELRYFHFSSKLASDPDLQQAVTASDPGTETALFSSLDQALQAAPGGGYGGIVCLTDGLDTTQGAPDQLATHAIQTRTPLYFVVGQNRQAVQESLIVRETSTPSHVLRKTDFNATALIEARSSQARDVKVTLLQEDKMQAEITLHLRPGANLLPWTVPIHADEPGQIHLKWKLGAGVDEETVAATIPVVAKDTVNVLYYQGSLDWGFRFINTALQRDASFSITGLFNPDLNLADNSAAQPASSTATPLLKAFPDSVAALQPYQMVVLADAFADQMTAAQQKALADYVRQGGGLFFLVSDTKMAQTFSGTALESMLPVVFDPPPPSSQGEDTLEQFQDMMHRVGGVNYGSETDFASDAQAQAGPDALKAFLIPAKTSRQQISQLFGKPTAVSTADIPMFSTYAHVASLKAGAEALAVHPVDVTPAKEPRVLLATQRYGKGQVTALMTDALWRWKLSLSSDSHRPEAFWQQLFLALAGPSGSMHFTRQPYFAAQGEHAIFHLDGATGVNTPVITAISPNASSPAQTPALEAGSHSGEWVFQLSPDAPGKWRIQARDSAGGQIETLLRVGGAATTGELSGLPPDIDGLRKLAQLTGGSVLNDGTPEGWSGRTAAPDLTVTSEHVHPLWNTWAVLLVALAFYAVELVWRRRAKLL